MARTAYRQCAVAVALALGAASCALPSAPTGEDLRAQAMPNTQAPTQWTAGPTVAGDVADGWLALFDDPALPPLVRDAIAHNPDLRVAAARVEAAEASARAAGAALWPQVNAAGRGGGKMAGDNSGLSVLGLFASWELDVWGRVRASRESAAAQAESAALDARYARESIAALVVKSWFVAREATVQRAIALSMVEDSRSLAALAGERRRVGKGDDFEVAQAEASTLAYQDLVLQADIARQNALRAIEILAGRYPAAALDPSAELPAPGASIPAGLPSQLLERRPDVRAAERRVAAAFYRVREAEAARLPRISLTAGVNTVSSELFVLKERDNPVWGIGGSFMAPLFNAGALQAQVDVRTAEQKAAVADYARVGSRAFGEVEGALSAAIILERRADVLARAVTANERALGFARVRYDVGSGDQRGVHQQLLALHASRTSLVHVRTERLVQRVNLHLALGGSF